MSTLTISEPHPNGPEQFDAATFAAYALSSPEKLAAVLDHSLVKPDATRTRVLELCREAAEYRFACATVNPCWVSLATAALAGTGIPVGVVLGFPLGANLPASKKAEAAEVLKLGVHDIDMVLNIGLLKSGLAADYDAVRQDIRDVVEQAHDHGAIVKVVLETCLLTFEEKLRGAELAIGAGADFLQTSTGFSTGGATTDDLTLLRSTYGNRVGVKASGGIRSLADASAMLKAGASRIGASASVRIVSELASR